MLPEFNERQFAQFASLLSVFTRRARARRGRSVVEKLMQLCARAGVCSGIDYIRSMNVRFIFGLLAVGWLFSQPLRARAQMGEKH